MAATIQFLSSWVKHLLRSFPTSKPFFSTLVSLRPGIDRRYLIEYIEIDENICDIEIDTRQVSSSVEIVFPLSQNNLTSADEYKIYG